MKWIVKEDIDTPVPKASDQYRPMVARAIALVGNWSRDMLGSGKELPPTFFVVARDRSIVVVPSHQASQEETLEIVKIVAQKHDAVAVIMSMYGSKTIVDEKGIQAVDECLVMQVEMLDSVTIFSQKRDGDSFGKYQIDEYARDEAIGNFTGLIPPPGWKPSKDYDLALEKLEDLNHRSE